MNDMTLTREQWDTINARLREPFDPAFISFRAQGTPRNGKCEVLAYIDARDVQDRLDEAAGAGNWSFDWEALHYDARGNITLVKGNLTIHGVRKSDVGEASTFSPSKGAVSDSLKRAAAQWGIARYLYDLPKMYAPVEGNGHINPTILTRLRDKLPKPGDIKGRAQFDDAGEHDGEGASAQTTNSNGNGNGNAVKRQQPAAQPKQPAAATEATDTSPPLDERLQAILDNAPDLRRTYQEADKYGLRGGEFFRVFLNVTGLSKAELKKPLAIGPKQQMAAYVARLAEDAKATATRATTQEKSA